MDVLGGRDDHSTLHLYDSERRRSSVSPRRTSGASSVSGKIIVVFVIFIEMLDAAYSLLWIKMYFSFYYKIYYHHDVFIRSLIEQQLYAIIVLWYAHVEMLQVMVLKWVTVTEIAAIVMILKASPRDIGGAVIASVSFKMW